MGTPVPPPPIVPPVPAGAPCSTCWGIGKPFGDGETPASVIVVLSGISKGPNWQPVDGEPLDGDFLIPQFASCDYRSPSFPLSGFRIAFFSASTFVVIMQSPGIFYFFGTTVGACSTIIVSPLSDHFAGGTMKIYIPEVIE